MIACSSLVEDQQLQDVLDALVSHVAVLDHTGTIVAVNAAWRTFAEANAAPDTDPHLRTGIGTSYLDVCRGATGASSDESDEVVAGITAVLQGSRPRYELDFPCPAPGVPRWFRLRVTPLSSGGSRRCLVEHLDITERTLSTALVTAQGQVLEAVATGRPLRQIFEQIVDLVEAQLPDALCSILQVEPSTMRLKFVAGQHLPADYNRAVDGVPVGPAMGSCGTAAFRKAPVDVLDIATDPLWVDFRALALGHGLRSCLSIPVLASGNVIGAPRGEVLATFAIYHREPRSPLSPWADQSRGVLGLAAAHLVGVAIERDRAEAAVRNSEARLRAILDHSPALIFLKDLAGRHALVNRPLAELGASTEPCEGKTTQELLGPTVAELFVDGHRSVIATHEVDQREEEVELHDGRHLRLLSVQFPLFDAAGGLSGVGGISTDITSRVRAETERDRLWAHSPDPVCIAALDATLIDVNAEWTRRFGWTSSELRGRAVDELVHPEDAPATALALETLRRGEPVRGLEHRFRCRNGEYRWLSWNALSLLDAGRWYGFVRDITDERQLQEQLRQSQKLEAIGQLAGGVAHDFNNLLTVIQSDVAIMAESLAPETPDFDLLHEIEQACERASALTRQLLTFSRRAIVELRTIDLDKAVEVSSRMLRRLIGEHIHLEIELGAGASVRADPGQLEQVLMNLVLNARDAMPRGGPLRIATTISTVERDDSLSLQALAPGRYVVISVTDGGAGIDPAVLGRIFEPFFTTKVNGLGTGLGLATVYGIVNQAGGRVIVASELGRGSVFRVFLPVVTEEAREVRPVARPTSTPGNETVLLVEDESGVRRIANRVLVEHGYRVLTASNGSEALELATSFSGRIDLVVTDVVMPELGGWALAQALRKQRPDLRVLYMSGYTEDEMVRHGIEMSRDHFLNKPFTPSVLASKVREVIEGLPVNGLPAS